MLELKKISPSNRVSRYKDVKQNPIPQNGLMLHLDANNATSYPGSGTIWYDLSPLKNNYNIVATAYQSSGNIRFMNFGGSHGCAKNATDINYASTGNATIITFTQVLNSTANWRTLTRSYVNDHHVIIQAGSNTLGMYDNDSNQFISSGIDVTNISSRNLTTSWNMLVFELSSRTPQYKFLLNSNTSNLGTISNANAAFTRGWGSIGAYHDVNTTPSSASQYWGNISVFMVYNRHISTTEQLAIYQSYASIFGL